MDPQQLLSQLKDVHTPEPITWWPPAIGWWILLLVSVLAVVALVYFSLRRYRAGIWRRDALKKFQGVKANYLARPDADNLVEIIKLIKRSLASSHSTELPKSLVGPKWREALETNIPNLRDEDLSVLVEGQYQASTPVLDSSALDRIEAGIKGLKL